MSDKDQELLDQILRETEARKSRNPVSEESLDLNVQDTSVTESVSAENPVSESAAEQAVNPEKDSETGLQQVISAQHAEASEPQPVSDTGTETEASTEEILDSEAESAAHAEEAAVQTVQKPTKQPGVQSVQGAPKKRKKKIVRKKFSFVDVLRGLFPWKGDSVLEGTRKVVFLVSIIGFSICLNQVVTYYYGRYRNQEIYGEIQNEIGDIAIPEPEGSDSAEGSVTEYLELSELGEKLLAKNPDSVGYISIPGTKVNYPVVQRKDPNDGNGYYLYRSFNGEDNDAGSIFLDYRCYFDDTVDGKRTYKNSTNLVIYGHNMNDSSMFGSLKYYKNDYSYYEQHPLIVLNSCYETYTYKIFGFYICDSEDETDTRFDYWNTLNFQTEDEFYDYVNKVKRRTLRHTNVDVKYGDQLLTLSTCHGSFESAKLVVMARMLRPGEDPYEGTTGSELNDNVLWPTIYYRWNRNTYDPDAPFIPYGPAEDSTDAVTDTTAPDNKKEEEDSAE